MDEAITTINPSQTVSADPASKADMPTKEVDAEREQGRYVTVWLQYDEKQPVLAPIAEGEGTLRAINCASVAEFNHLKKTR